MRTILIMLSLRTSSGMERVSVLFCAVLFNGYLDKNSVSMNFYKKFRETQLLENMEKLKL